MKITQTVKHFESVGSKWIQKGEEAAEITRKEYDMIVENRFKGDYYYKGYTCLGYTPIKIVSRFENIKTVREFEITK